MDKLNIAHKDLFNDSLIKALKANYIKQYRLNELNMTIEQVEQEFGVDRGYLSRMENAKANPKIYWDG